MAPIPQDRRDRIAERLAEVSGGSRHERRMQVIVGDEVRSIVVTDSAEASKLGYQYHAVGVAMSPGRGDDTWLQGLAGETVTGIDPTTGEPVTWQLQTDSTVIAHMYESGDLDEYEVYEETPS